MHIHDFEKLEIDQKADLLWNKGIVLVAHEGAVLYSLFNYFIELKISQQGIVSIDAFEEGTRLSEFVKKARPA